MEDKNENVETTEPVVTEPVQEEVKEEPVVAETPTEAVAETPIEHEQPSMQMEPNTPTTEPVKKQGKGKLIGIIIAVVVVVLFIGGLLFLPSLLVSKKSVVDKEITTVFSELIKTVKEVEKNSVEYDFDRDSIGLEGTLTVSSDYKTDEIDLSKLKDYAISYQGAIDKKGNKASASLKLSGKKPILDVVTMIKEKDVFINLGDIYDKTIVTETEEEVKDLNLDSISATELEILLTNTEKSIKENIKKEDIKEAKVEKTINGKKAKYKEITYEMNINETSKKVLEGYIDDDEVLGILAKTVSKDKKDVKKDLEELIKSINTDSNDKLIIKLYTSGLFRNVKGLELTSDDTTLTVDIDKDTLKYAVSVNNQKLGNGEYNKSKKELTYEFKQDGSTLTADIKFKDNNDISGNISLKAGSMKLNVDIESINKKSGKSSTNDLTVKVKYNDGSEKFNVELKCNNKITVGAKVEEISAKNTVKAEDMTDEEVMDVYNQLMNKLSEIIVEIYPAYAQEVEESLNV